MKDSSPHLAGIPTLTTGLPLSRRKFLQTAAVAGASAALLPIPRRSKAGSRITPADVDLAFSYINQQMDLFSNSFAVVSSPGAPGNHFFALAEIGDILDAANIDTCAQDQIPPTGALASIKSTFQNVNGTNFGGWIFLNGTLTGKETAPSANFGTAPDAGVDLTGATQLTFWARGENGGEQIQFFMGGVGRNSAGVATAPHPDSTPQVPPSGTVTTLTQQWQQYTIDVSNANLSYVLGGFGWVAAAAQNPNGANFWVADIQYNRSRLNDPRFVRSYLPLSLTGFDLVVANAAETFDNALAILAYLARGTDDDMRRASLIGQAFVYAQAHDPFYSDGRLRNAYQAGDLTVPPGWAPNGRSGAVSLPVIISCSGGASAQDEVQVSSGTGNLAWAAISLLALSQKLGDTSYLNAAMELGKWITARRQKKGFGGFLAGSLGFDGSAVQQGTANTSDNLAVFAAFTTMASATGQESWQILAGYAAKFVEQMYDPSLGCLITGSLSPSTPNRDYLLVEDQAMAVLALPQPLTTFPGFFNCAENNFLTSKDGFTGFDSNEDRDGIWFAGTGMMTAAYQVLGSSASASTYLQQLGNAQASALNSNGQGLVEASHDGVTTGFTSPNGQPILLYSRLHIGTTALYSLAELGVNPCYPIPPLVPAITSVSTDGKELIVIGQNFVTRAVILVNSQAQSTTNDPQNPTTRLIAKKAGKTIQPGDQVQVQNPNGSVSNIITF